MAAATKVPLTEAERAQYLVDHLENGYAQKFADKIGIDKTRISKILHGKLHINSLYERILSAYPAVSRDWLYTGMGYAGDLDVEAVRERMTKALEEKDRLIMSLTQTLDAQRKVIEKLTK